jgi:hypothetical protein
VFKREAAELIHRYAVSLNRDGLVVVCHIHDMSIQA